MKNYILINPLLVEALTDKEQAELEKLENDLRNGNVPLSELGAVEAQVRKLKNKRDAEKPAPAEEPKQSEPEQEPKQGPKQPAVDIGTKEDFIADKAREFARVGGGNVGDLSFEKLPPGKSRIEPLSQEERDEIAEMVIPDLLDFYLRKYHGLKTGQNIPEWALETVLANLSEILFGLDIADLLYGDYENIFELVEPNILSIAIGFAEWFETLTVGEDDILTDNEKQELYEEVYYKLSLALVTAAYFAVGSKALDTAVKTARASDLSKAETIKLLKENRSLFSKAFTSDAEFKKIVDDAMKKEGFVSGKNNIKGEWGPSTKSWFEKTISSMVMKYIGNTPTRFALGPIWSISKKIFESYMIQNINETSIDLVIGKNAAGMTVDEKIAELNKQKDLLTKELENVKKDMELLPNPRDKDFSEKQSAQLQKAAERLEERIKGLDNQIKIISQKLRRLVLKYLEEAFLFAPRVVARIGSPLLNTLSGQAFEDFFRYMFRDLDEIIVVGPLDFKVVSDPTDAKTKNLSNLYVDLKDKEYLKKAAQKEADYAAKLQREGGFKGGFIKVLNGLKALSDPKKGGRSAKKIAQWIRTLGGVLKEQQETKGSSDFFTDIQELYDKIEKQQEEISKFAKETRLRSLNLVDVFKDAMAELIREDLDELEAGFTSAGLDDVPFQTPVDESKIKITKSKLIDLISDQVKEQTQTIEVDKVQLIALIAEEAQKQISRKK